MKKFTCILFIGLAILACLPLQSQNITSKKTELSRKEIIIPNVGNYQSLKCDFHIHTVFSDGKVWPTVRVQEAWMEGLDVISITDHIEYHPHKNDVNTDNNKSYDIALPEAKKYNILLIKGSEITRKMPPGHLNAIFLNDSEKLYVKDSIAAIQEANNQGAFVFWNHPPYPHPENKAVWSDLHETLYKNNQLQGIEIVNAEYYYPEAQQWCIDKNLTMLGNSDIHNPIGFDYQHTHRPMTIVFAKEKTIAAVKESLNSRRTVVLWENNFIGTEEYLAPLFDATLSVGHTYLKHDKLYVHLSNNSSVPLDISIIASDLPFNIDKNIIIPPLSTVNMEIQDLKSDTQSIELPCKVNNYWVKPNTPLNAKIRIKQTIK